MHPCCRLWVVEEKYLCTGAVLSIRAFWVWVVFVEDLVSPEQRMFGIVGLLGAIAASTLDPEQSIKRILLATIVAVNIKSKN